MSEKHRKRDRSSPAKRDRDHDPEKQRKDKDLSGKDKDMSGSDQPSKSAGARPSVFDRLGLRSDDKQLSGQPSALKKPKKDEDGDSAAATHAGAPIEASDKPKDKENDREDRPKRRSSSPGTAAAAPATAGESATNSSQQRPRKFTALNLSQRVQPSSNRQPAGAADADSAKAAGRRLERGGGGGRSRRGRNRRIRNDLAPAPRLPSKRRARRDADDDDDGNVDDDKQRSRSRSLSTGSSRHSSAGSRSSASASGSSVKSRSPSKSKSKSPVPPLMAAQTQKQQQQQSDQTIDQVELARELYRRKLANLPQPSAIKERRERRRKAEAEAAAAASYAGPPGTNIVVGLDDDLPSPTRAHRYKYANMPFAPPGRRRLRDDESPAAVGAAAAAAAKAAAAAEAARLAEPCILTEVLYDLEDLENVSDSELTLPEEEDRLATLLGPPPAPHRGIVESLGVDWNVLRSAGAAAAGHQHQQQQDHHHHQQQYYYQRPADLLPGPVLCRLGVSKRLAGEQLFRLVSGRLAAPGLLNDRPYAHRSQLARLRAREAPLLGCAGPHGGGALSARVDLAVRRFLLASLSGAVLG